MTGKLLSATCLLGLVVGGCRIADPPPFDPREVHVPERTEARENMVEPMNPLPTTLQSPFLSDQPTTEPVPRPSTGPVLAKEPVRRVSLRELVQRAAATSLDVRVAGYDPAINQARVIEEQARFDPVWFSRAQYERRDNLTAGTILTDPNNPFSSFVSTEESADVYTAATGLRQNLSSGGQAELRYQAAESDLDPSRYLINPYWENTVVLQVTQPLLRGFGNEINRARITIARNNQKISFYDFRKALEENLANIEQAYWRLVAAERDVAVQEDLLRRTEETAALLARRGAQDVTRVQTSEANARVEQRRALLIRAKSRVRDLSDQLKRLVNDPDLPVTGPTLLLPATEPIEEPVQFDLADLIDTAMEHRLELAQQQVRIDSQSLITRVAKNNLLPQLNAVGSVGAQGLGEDFSDSVDTQADLNHLSYQIGLELEVPIGNRQARAIYQRSLLQRQQAIDQYRALTEQVALDVRLALREVQTSWDEIVSGRQARFAAADALRALELREEANEPLTPDFVSRKLDAQGRLAEAQRTEIFAITAYNNAIAQLERAKGTLLRYDNVLMQEEARPFMVQLRDLQDR